MNNRAKYLLIFLGATAAFIFIVGMFWRSPTVTPPPTPEKTNPPKVGSTIPFSPQSVKFNQAAQPNVSQPLPIYKVSGQLLMPISSAAAAQMAQRFGFIGPAQTIPAYRGGTNYTFSDNSGRVLTIKENPPTLNYSELQKESSSTSLPTISQANSLAQELAKKVIPSLPVGWRLAEVKSDYLKSTGSSATVMPSAQGANLVEISLGYYYLDYKVGTPDGKFEFIKAVFGNYGTVVSFKAAPPLNNPNFSVIKEDEVLSPTLSEVQQKFTRGLATAVFLGLANERTDEPILTPPTVVTAEKLEPVLILSTDTLQPFYLVTAKGTLNSNRTGEVLYLLPLAE